MPPHTQKFFFFFICKSYIILKASSAPNGSTEEKLKSIENIPILQKKKTFQYQKIGENINESLTKVP